MTVAIRFTLVILTATGVVLAQTPTGGWRRVGDPPPATAATAPAPTPAPSVENQDPTEPVDRSPVDAEQPQNQAAQQPQSQAPQQPGLQPETQPEARPAGREGAPNNTPPPYGAPAYVTLQPGTYVTVRINQALSSDRNQPGDSFSATLTQPVVADGIVIAQRGQTVYGRVAETRKASANHPSRLGLELTGVTLVDGTQQPIHSQLVAAQGRSTPGAIQAGEVAGSTAVGAGIGGMVGWGTGAAIGGAVGAAGGLLGVLLTRHHPTVVYPETALTFRVASPVTISTADQQAFRYVTPEDYQQPQYNAQMQRRPARPVPAQGYYGPGYGYPAYPAYPYPYAYYPYPYAYGWGPYWGPGFGMFIGGRGSWGGRRWWR